ncbi:Short-chain dehydrogenase/reductase SDR [Macrophomina phaseolina MS6]|uniref:Short-chain dehydrogenase/reductase SDR n=1 Tax=Macrophomina phaseolina (strain MS6) TaxID=1126212 RepID=K2R6Z4_MACPH|nr:Short-chain dehydrogenase/reductase SDR [Macrophomina phaseolina MS6]
MGSVSAPPSLSGAASVASPAPLAHNVIAITGGGSGIGRATAHLLAARGAAVSIADVNAESLATVESSILELAPGARVLTAALDVRDRAAVAAWIKATTERLGPLTGAANLAGVINDGLNVKTVEETPDEEWDRVLGVNLTGAMVCLSEEVREMKRTAKKLDEGGRGGFSIVNASSIIGLKGSPRASAYAAAKHGVIGLTKSVAREAGEWGIRVNAIAPGVIITPMTLHQPGAKEGQKEWNKLAPLGRAGEAEEVAEVIAWLLSANSSYITGMVHEVDGGIMA